MNEFSLGKLCMLTQCRFEPKSTGVKRLTFTKSSLVQYQVLKCNQGWSGAGHSSGGESLPGMCEARGWVLALQKENCHQGFYM